VRLPEPESATPGSPGGPCTSPARAPLAPRPAKTAAQIAAASLYRIVCLPSLGRPMASTAVQETLVWLTEVVNLARRSTLSDLANVRLGSVDRAGSVVTGPVLRGSAQPAGEDSTPRRASSYFLAALLPAAMITKTAKAIKAHQATLSVSFCHFRTSHMVLNPNLRGSGRSRWAAEAPGRVTEGICRWRFSGPC
jgi:hypothetical protein